VIESESHKLEKRKGKPVVEGEELQEEKESMS